MQSVKYTASDFIDADINIKSVNNVYHSTQPSWWRGEKKPRSYDGLIYFVDGSIEYDFGCFSFRALPGQVIRLPGGIPYCGKKLSREPLVIYCVDFLTENIDEYNKLPLPYNISPVYCQEVVAMFEKMNMCFNNHEFCSKLECKSILLSLLSTLLKDHAANNCQYDDNCKIIKYIKYISLNYRRCDFRISDISKQFHVSDTQLRRIFNSELGVSPIEYLVKFRIEQAKHLLITQRELSIKEIAFECGYSSVYYFSNSFHVNVGYSPLEFRQRT